MGLERGTSRVSLRMAEPTEMAGTWEVSSGRTTCRLQFGSDRVEAANAYAVAGAACLGAIIASPVIGWRPAPDGIELAGSDRSTLAMFADQGDGTGVATLPTGTATLRRAR